MDVTVLEDCVRSNVGDITFEVSLIDLFISFLQESYRKQKISNFGFLALKSAQCFNALFLLFGPRSLD
jgi:hypothetical protein